MTVKTYHGNCHCEAIQFEVCSDIAELTTCNCSICTKKNALMVKVHERDFRLVTGQDFLQAYQFHTRTATHYFCKRCGIYPFHRKRVTPDFYGINVFCLVDFDVGGFTVRATDGINMD